MRKWQPSPNDATSLAAFRWFANAIENDAIALYATEPSTYKHVEDVLRKTLRELKYLKTKHSLAEEENGCPDGYVLCDGICMPSCDPMEE